MELDRFFISYSTTIEDCKPFTRGDKEKIDPENDYSYLSIYNGTSEYIDARLAREGYEVSPDENYDYVIKVKFSTLEEGVVDPRIFMDIFFDAAQHIFREKRERIEIEKGFNDCCYLCARKDYFRNKHH